MFVCGGVESRFNRFRKEAMLLIPHTRAVQARVQDVLVEATAGFGFHGLGKDGVVAMPLLLSLDGLQEETGAFHRFQDGLAVSSPRHGIAEGSRQTVEHAGGNGSACWRKERVSSREKRKSLVCISSSSSRARKPGSGRGGSLRVISTI